MDLIVSIEGKEYTLPKDYRQFFLNHILPPKDLVEAMSYGRDMGKRIIKELIDRRLLEIKLQLDEYSQPVCCAAKNPK